VSTPHTVTLYYFTCRVGFIYHGHRGLVFSVNVTPAPTYCRQSAVHLYIGTTAAAVSRLTDVIVPSHSVFVVRCRDDSYSLQQNGSSIPHVVLLGFLLLSPAKLLLRRSVRTGFRDGVACWGLSHAICDCTMSCCTSSWVYSGCVPT